MIYTLPSPDAPIDQGDIVDGCPLLEIVRVNLRFPDSPEVICSIHRVVVLTQTCDLANQKTQQVVVALVHDARQLVAQNIVKAADVADQFGQVVYLVGISCPLRANLHWKK